MCIAEEGALASQDCVAVDVELGNGRNERSGFNARDMKLKSYASVFRQIF